MSTTVTPTPRAYITFSFFFCSRQSWTQTPTLPNIYRRLVPGDPDPGGPYRSYPMDGYALIPKTYVLVRVTPFYHLLQLIHAF